MSIIIYVLVKLMYLEGLIYKLQLLSLYYYIIFLIYSFMFKEIIIINKYSFVKKKTKKIYSFYILRILLHLLD